MVVFFFFHVWCVCVCLEINLWVCGVHFRVIRGGCRAPQRFPRLCFVVSFSLTSTRRKCFEFFKLLQKQKYWGYVLPSEFQRLRGVFDQKTEIKLSLFRFRLSLPHSQSQPEHGRAILRRRHRPILSSSLYSCCCCTFLFFHFLLPPWLLFWFRKRSGLSTTPIFISIITALAPTPIAISPGSPSTAPSGWSGCRR